MDEKIRYGSVKACKWVDEVLFPAPWFPTVKTLNELNCDFTAHDAEPYVVAGQDDCYQETKQGGRFLATLRTSGLSTTDILSQILKERVS